LPAKGVLFAAKAAPTELVRRLDKRGASGKPRHTAGCAALIQPTIFWIFGDTLASLCWVTARDQPLGRAKTYQAAIQPQIEHHEQQTKTNENWRGLPKKHRRHN